jgi:biopolymer transport protein ExbD
MGMGSSGGRGEVTADINVTPMADVMLVLLIIFMVVTPMLQKGVSVELAKTKNPVDMKEADRDDAVLVAVTRDGKFYLGQEGKRSPGDQT